MKKDIRVRKSLSINQTVDALNSSNVCKRLADDYIDFTDRVEKPKPMTASEMGKKGAIIANAKRTTEERRKSAKLGWITRRAAKPRWLA